jgi:malonate decarboxylase epsilon subunit
MTRATFNEGIAASSSETALPDLCMLIERERSHA